MRPQHSFTSGVKITVSAPFELYGWEDMKSLVTIALAVSLALPLALNAQAGNASSPAQNAPAAPSAGNAPAANPTAQAQQPVERSKHKKKLNKVKKSNCVSPSADSGLPDYCRNPYWEPRDWDYIRNNSGRP
jgi:Ni/Co efflux regulator RcnB